MNDLLNYLRREDKWYLGGGDKLIWTPPFPRWLDRLGFWDEAHYYTTALSPLFTLTLLDEHGNEIAYRFRKRQWQPNVLVQYYDTDMGLEIVEWKSLLPNDVLVSKVSLKNRTNKPMLVHLMMWTAQRCTESTQRISNIEADTSTDRPFFGFHASIPQETRPSVEIGCAFGMNGYAISHASQLAELSKVTDKIPCPTWQFTPFADTFDGRFLNDRDQIQCQPDLNKEIYMALHQLLDFTGKSDQAEKVLNFGFAAAPSTRQAAANLKHAFASPKKVLQPASEIWKTHFASVPTFLCSNPFFQKYYWHRWYGLRLFQLKGGETQYPNPTLTEGLGVFRLPTAFSTPAHILETRWMNTPDLAQGAWLNFAHHQQNNGKYTGQLYPNAPPEKAFYHANWAHLKALHLNHPDLAFLQLVYYSLERYVNFLDQERDREHSGLYDVINPQEIGQVYSSRFLSVCDNLNALNEATHFRLKGVDATVYVYEMKRFLAWIAEQMRDQNEAETWHEEAEKIRKAVLRFMWDDKKQLFFDVNPKTGRKTGVKAATCFYPYFTDMVREKHLDGLKQHLLNPSEFWTPFPVPSIAIDDPYFDANGTWQGQRKNCPSNGRVWLMTNSHIAEALAQSAIRFKDTLLRQKTAEFITRFIEMLFHQGDVSKPNSFEHYHPFNGKPSSYRGMDDHQHSWINELIIKYVCGIRPAEHHVLIDPFPFDLTQFRIENVRIRHHLLGVTRHHDTFSLTINGNEVATSTLGKPIKIEI